GPSDRESILLTAPASQVFHDGTLLPPAALSGQSTPPTTSPPTPSAERSPANYVSPAEAARTGPPTPSKSPRADFHPSSLQSACTSSAVGSRSVCTQVGCVH